MFRCYYNSRRLYFNKILIANRGEIACRIIRTCKRLGIKTVGIFSEADTASLHAQLAHESYLVGPAIASKSYLSIESICNVLKESNCDAVHPGYGFLSENFKFAQAITSIGAKFIGPPVEAIQSMGSKKDSKNIMINSGVPVIPGYNGDNQDDSYLAAEAEKIGYPVLIKAVLGGGGKGMRISWSKSDFLEKLQSSRSEALKSFNDQSVILEKFIRNPRHIEVQIFADSHGNIVYLFERDCSSQRRHQKIIEEAPADNLDDENRKKLGETAVTAARAVGYIGAGTVEFILDKENGQFYFLEMNTRLQVEHPITEMITGVDLVEWQIVVASGEKLPKFQDDLKVNGHSIETRIYAENPMQNFAPDAGLITRLIEPADNDMKIRFETGIRQGDYVSMFYDPMIAKLIVHGKNRQEALKCMLSSLENLTIYGPSTNISFIKALLIDDCFQKGSIDANYIDNNYQNFLPKNIDQNVLFCLGSLAIFAKENISRWSSLNYNICSDIFLGYENIKRVVKLRSSVNNKIEISIDQDFSKNCEYIKYESVDSYNSQDFVVLLDKSIYKVHAIHGMNNVDIYIDDTKYTLLLQDASKDKVLCQSSGDDFIVKSSMPCKISEVYVKVGDKVKIGTKLVTTEAMKMEQIVKSKVNGVVKKVHCRQGQLIENSKILIELTPK